jgi:hypothetical protein
MKTNEFEHFKQVKQLKLDGEGKGWNVNAIDPQLTDFYAYLLDPLDTGFIFAFAGGYQGFEAAEKNSFTMKEVTSLLGALIKQNSTEHEVLANASLCYFVKTQTYQLLKPQLPAVGQVPIIVLIRYGRPGDNNGSLRPFALFHDTGLINPAKLSEICAPVIDRDKHNHPEWFPSAEIVPFRAQ